MEDVQIYGQILDQLLVIMIFSRKPASNAKCETERIGLYNKPRSKPNSRFNHIYSIKIQFFFYNKVAELITIRTTIEAYFMLKSLFHIYQSRLTRYC